MRAETAPPAAEKVKSLRAVQRDMQLGGCWLRCDPEVGDPYADGAYGCVCGWRA